MKKGRYSEDQMGKILREANKAPVAEIKQHCFCNFGYLSIAVSLLKTT